MNVYHILPKGNEWAEPITAVIANTPEGAVQKYLGTNIGSRHLVEARLVEYPRRCEKCGDAMGKMGTQDWHNTQHVCDNCREET
jgi:hypothetical protein